MVRCGISSQGRPSELEPLRGALVDLATASQPRVVRQATP